MANVIFSSPVLVKSLLNILSYPELGSAYVFIAEQGNTSANATTPVDTPGEQAFIRDNMLSLTRISPSDCSLVIPRVDWSESAYEKNDYVLTSNNDVFVLLGKSYTANSVSNTEPTGSVSFGSDGHYWGKSFSVDNTNAKFLTTSFIPVLGRQSFTYDDGEIMTVFVDPQDSYATANGSVTIYTDGSGFEGTSNINTGFSIVDVEIVTGGANHVHISNVTAENYVSGNVDYSFVTSGNVCFQNGPEFFSNSVKLMLIGDFAGTEGNTAFVSETIYAGDHINYKRYGILAFPKLFVDTYARAARYYAQPILRVEYPGGLVALETILNNFVDNRLFPYIGVTQSNANCIGRLSSVVDKGDNVFDLLLYPDTDSFVGNVIQKIEEFSVNANTIGDISGEFFVANSMSLITPAVNRYSGYLLAETSINTPIERQLAQTETFTTILG